jgi:pimeloyl-ACP methyl ester carboxylesterase
MAVHDHISLAQFVARRSPAYAVSFFLPMNTPPALDGLRREISPPGVGLISWYQDVPAEATAASRPLLLVHSVNAAGSAYEVKPIYDHYRRSRPVYALDLPGFGLSDRSRRPYTPRLMTDALHALVAEIRRAHGGMAIDAMALSLSCEFLARAATETPDAFRSLALVSPTGFNRLPLREGPPGSDLGMPRLHAVLAAPGLGRWLFGQLTRRSVIAYFLRRTWGAPGIDAGLLDYDYAVTRPAGAEHAPLRFLTGFLFSGDSGTIYRSLRNPVWVVHGVRGDFVDYQGLEAVRGQPNWKIDVLPTGALPHFEMLPEFIRRYGTWLVGLGF